VSSETLYSLLLLSVFVRYVPASFAAIGCAAMGVSVTQTLSTAVMVIELTGQVWTCFQLFCFLSKPQQKKKVNLLLPVLVASIISFMISQAVTGKVGLYERVALDRRLPLLFDLPHRLLQMSAADIMTTVTTCFFFLCFPFGCKNAVPQVAWDSPGEGRVTVIEAQCTLETLDALLDDGFDPSASYPVVESIQSKVCRCLCVCFVCFLLLLMLAHVAIRCCLDLFLDTI